MASARTIPRHSPAAGRRYRSPTPTFPSPTPTARRSSRPGSRSNQPAIGRRAYRRGIAARHHGFALQSLHRRHHAQRLRPRARTIRRPCTRWSSTPRAFPLPTASSRSPSTTVPPTAMSPRPTCTSFSHRRTSRRCSISTPTTRRRRAQTISPCSPRGPAVAIVDADVSIIDNDSPNLASATVTLTNGDPLGSLTFNGTTPRRHLRFRLGHTCQLRSRAPHRLPTIRRRCSKSRSTTPTPILRPKPASSTLSSMTAPATATRHRRLIQVEAVNNSAPVLDLDADELERLVSKHFPERVHRKRRPGADRRCRYLHHRCRQHHAFVRDDQAGEPANRRSAHGQRGVAGSDHHGWLRSRYRRPHAHRFGHAG